MNCNIFNVNIIKRSVGFLIHRQLLQLVQGLQAINNSVRKAEVLESSKYLSFTTETLSSEVS